jgi:signal transduction histidine kinase
MTRRLAITILLTVWAMLITGGVVAYAVTRAVLLDYFDESLLAYAASVPGLRHDARGTPALAPMGGDRFLVKDDLNRTVARAGNDRETEPKLVSANFSYAQGQRLRTVEVKAFAENRKPVTVIYTRSAAAFDDRMNHLAAAFAIFGVAAGLLTAAVAWWVSRAALRPLKQTVKQIEAIDERHLDSRVDATALPPEMRPMAQQLNDLLARLEAAFAARQRFLADASHELRTPLAALILAMEVSLHHPRNAADYQTTIQNCLADANQLRQLVERLMEQVRSQNLSHDE